MSILILGSREVTTAFALGGMKGRVVHDRREALAVIEEPGCLTAVKVLVVEEQIANMAREAIDRLKLDPTAPLVVEIPGFSGPSEDRQTARDLVRRALGIRI